MTPDERRRQWYRDEAIRHGAGVEEWLISFRTPTAISWAGDEADEREAVRSARLAAHFGRLALASTVILDWDDNEVREVITAQRAAALRLAKEATNGWACYAKRQIEHNEILRLHRDIAILGGSHAD